MARTKRHNRDISSKVSVLETARRVGRAFDLSREASPELRQDRDVVLAALQAQGNNLRHCDERFRADRELVWAAVSSNGMALKYCEAELRNDRAVVQAAVANRGPAIADSSEAFRGDRELALLAVSRCASALEYVSNELRNDKEIVMTAIRTGVQQSPLNQHWVLASASVGLRADREVVQAAIEHLGGAVLMHAAFDIQDDRNIVLSAIQKNGLALEYASDDLRADRDLVLRAISRDGRALQFASPSLQDDKEVVLSAVGAPDSLKQGEALKYASKELQADRDVVMKAVSQAGNSITFAAPSLSADRQVVETAMANRQNVRASVILRVAAPALRADRSIVHRAIEVDSLSLQYASEDLQMDPDTVSLAWTTIHNNHDFDLFNNFEESTISKLYAAKAAYLRKELGSAAAAQDLLDVDNPQSIQQRANDWLKESEEKKLLLRKVILRSEFPVSVHRCIESFSGMNEDIALAGGIAQFGTVLVHTKMGLADNFHQHSWDSFVKDASESTNERDLISH
jgi:hypothetical protein